MSGEGPLRDEYRVVGLRVKAHKHFTRVTCAASPKELVVKFELAPSGINVHVAHPASLQNLPSSIAQGEPVFFPIRERRSFRSNDRTKKLSGGTNRREGLDDFRCPLFEKALRRVEVKLGDDLFLIPETHGAPPRIVRCGVGARSLLKP